MPNLSVRNLTAKHLKTLDRYGRTYTRAIARVIEAVERADERADLAEANAAEAIGCLRDYARAVKAAKEAMDTEAEALARLLTLSEKLNLGAADVQEVPVPRTRYTR